MAAQGMALTLGSVAETQLTGVLVEEARGLRLLAAEHQ